MRKRGRLGSRLCAAVAVILVGMPAFGSAALAQQAQEAQTPVLARDVHRQHA